MHASVKLKNCESEWYVDDTKFFLPMSPKDAEAGLYHVSLDLKRVAQWCWSHSLLINPEKTKLMLFGVSQNIGRLPDVSIDFLGEILGPVSSCKDLGILLDPNLSYIIWLR